MTRVSPPTYLSWPSAGRGRILPPWLQRNLSRLLGEPGAEHGAEPEGMIRLEITAASVDIVESNGR
ncbi:UNVERIFIED_CONTAM: hypothetical protein Slati_3245500 [Sesamum latifolium]|uniref:Uncharacterized protein n=1 Tax=Sesamum latifolium TaxID=2727402 RepID=A0AAW2UYS8_9LAMI